MTRGEKGAAAAAVLALAGAAAWAYFGGGEVTLDTAAGLTAGYDPAQAHLAQPDEIPGGTLRGRHGLFRRHDGHAMRAALTGGGWSWFLDPPSEASL